MFHSAQIRSLRCFLPDSLKRSIIIILTFVYFSSQTNLKQDIDNLFLFPSQIASELSTPPQSPLKSKGVPFSFVRLSGEDSEIENDPSKLSEKPSVKRTGENDLATVVAPSRKRQVHGSTRLNHH